MIDLTGPPRPWPDRLAARFVDAQSRALGMPGAWSSPPPRGEPALLERLAELFGADTERTVVTGGVRQFAAAWTPLGTEAVVEAPSFLDIPELLGMGGRVRQVAWNAMAEAASRATGLTTLWVTTPFRNPDGLTVKEPLAADLGRLAARGHRVVVNQVYRWFAPDGAVPPVPVGAWTVTSLAKAAGGGSRLGWVTAPCAAAVSRDLTALGPPTAWQRAWAAFLRPRTFAALRSACVEPTQDARRAFTSRAADLLGWHVAGGGPSLLLECEGTDERRAVAALTDAGLRVSPGAAFGAPRPSVRLAFSGTDPAGATTAAECFAALAGRPGAPAFRPAVDADA
ncbi:pyridoxal phosphate-dependent aminotransferase [Streptomyces sp. NPDC127098]|uniref:pyridoxal phosphate-dependent aminotransferase n=1 Tax=Streptomyces sp. NPDC127098 TaxID=3347137 RepID=UPI00366967F1